MSAPECSIGDQLQRLHRVAGDGPDTEQRNHVRKDRRGERIPRIEHAANTLRIARLQRDDLQHVGVGASQIRPSGFFVTPSVYRARRSSCWRVVSSVNVSDSRGMLVTNGPTSQPKPAGIPRESDTDSQ